MAKENNETNRAKEELYRLLDEGIKAMSQNSGRPAQEVFAEIEKKFGFNENRQSE